jgi:hypothetical protein
MMGERGIWDGEFFADLADHHADGMGREQQADDAQPRFRPHGGQHVGIAHKLFLIVGGHSGLLDFYISTYIEI